MATADNSLKRLEDQQKIFNFMNENMISSSPIPLIVSGTLLLSLVLAFLAWFLFPGIRHRSLLSALIEKLNCDQFKSERNPDQLREAFPKDAQILHLWDEYAKTLYSSLPISGGLATPNWHSTVAAESFWNGQLVVDGRLKTEFFKHLPGIFTGLGIIGTFSGLITGLMEFKVSSDAEIARMSLEYLMHSVVEAFRISAVAITAAMVVTFLEKLLLSNLYAKVDDVAKILDTRFSSSAPEQFLEQTASHTEESATQLKQLKTELVKELRPVLQELSDSQTKTLERLTASLVGKLGEVSSAQIGASRSDNEALGKSIGEAIFSGLSGPLGEIKDAVQKASGEQSQSAIKLLQDVMTHFSQSLNDLLGGQINGINDLNQKTADAMQQAVSKLNELVDNLQTAGKDSTEAMATQMAKASSDMESRQAEITRTTQALVNELRQAITESHQSTAESVETTTGEMARRMAEAIEKMEQRQSSINESTKAFVEQIKLLVASSQTETNAKLQSTLGSLDEQLGVMLGNFRASQAEAMQAGQERDQKNADTAKEAVSTMVNSVDGLVEKIAEATAQMQASVAILATTTTSAISGMADGAEQVNSASRKFAASSDNVSATISQVANVSSRLSDVATSLATASASLQSSVDDYRLHRDAIGRLVAELNELIANAKSDVSMSSSVLKRIEDATGKLAQAQMETEKFMSGVATVLGQAHKDFRVSVNESLKDSNHKFQEKLASAVGMLSSSIKELEDVLSSVPVKESKK